MKQLVMGYIDVPDPELRRKPANTEAGRRLEVVEFLRERGVKRALIDGEQYYFCENIDKGIEDGKKED